MANFIEAGSRARSRFVDKAVVELQTTLTDPHVKRKLGQTADTLHRLSETIYVPNIVHGEVVIPEQYVESDALAVVPLRPWSRLSMEPNFARFTPKRREKALEIARSWEPAQGTPQWLDEYQASLLSHAERTEEKLHVRGNEALAVNRATKATLDDGEFKKANGTRIHFSPRPFVILRHQHATTPPSVFGHELKHVEQGNAQPIFLSSDDSTVNNLFKRRELEGLHVGAQIATAMRDTGRSLTASEETGIQIEELREILNRRQRDPFAPTTELDEALRRRGLIKWITQ